jgi:hypothetical protein
VLLLAPALAGCAVADKIVARNEYDQASDKYKQCMAANTAAPQQCNELRVAMEAAERKRDGISTDLEFLQFRPGLVPGHGDAN